ncbi:hypothetical protein ACJX0J_025077, partial [Zea mays]
MSERNLEEICKGLGHNNNIVAPIHYPIFHGGEGSDIGDGAVGRASKEDILTLHDQYKKWDLGQATGVARVTPILRVGGDRAFADPTWCGLLHQHLEWFTCVRKRDEGHRTTFGVIQS